MVLALVGNKTDLVNQRKVLREEAHQYAVSIGGTYYETSALQDEGEVPSGPNFNTMWGSMELESLKMEVWFCYLSPGIEEVFLNSAIGMIKLSEDNQCTSLRVYDSSDAGNPTAILQPPPPLSAAVQLDKGPTPGEQERVLACCWISLLFLFLTLLELWSTKCQNSEVLCAAKSQSAKLVFHLVTETTCS